MFINGLISKPSKHGLWPDTNTYMNKSKSPSQTHHTSPLSIYYLFNLMSHFVYSGDSERPELLVGMRIVGHLASFCHWHHPHRPLGDHGAGVETQATGE